MKLISGFLVFCLCIAVLYFVGLGQFLLDYEKDQCEMTYMFEYPQFVKIANEADKNHPKYELFAYSEGRFTQNARKMDFDGVPVLFIPGNAGSYKQVRSLASIALRKALNGRTPYHFDYFTVNLNGEYSGLSGPVLEDQLSYINASISTILRLYDKQKRFRPTSLCLVGHSMGGVLARKIVYSLPQQSTLIPIVLSLSGPLKRPALTLDYYLDNFYKDLTGDSPPYTTFVSLSGGFSDFLISPGIASLNDSNIVQAVTTNIPKSWVEANHVQILWCKQTVLAINRALFDSVDLKTKQISSDPVLRKRIFEHHLIKNSGVKVQQMLKMDSESSKLNSQGVWKEIDNRQQSIELLTGVKQPHWFMIPIKPGYDIKILAINLKVTEWIFACQGANKRCTETHHLSHLSEIAPTSKYKRRTAQFSVDYLLGLYPKMTHILLRVLPTDDPVVMHIDQYAKSKRTLNVELPNLWSLQRRTLLGRSPKNILHVDLQLPDLYHVWQSYNLYVDALKCDKLERHATAQLIVPWANQQLNQYFTDLKKDPLNVRLHSSKPKWATDQSAKITLTLEPSCDYRITIKPSILGILGQLARNYSNLLIAHIAIIVLLAFRKQLEQFSAPNGNFPIFFEAMCGGLKPYYIITSVKLLSKLIKASDWTVLVEDNLDFMILPLLLYLCSVGLVWLLAVGYAFAVVALESTLNKVTLKFVARTVRFPVTWTDHLMSGLHKLPVLVASSLIVISVTACGGLAIAVGTVFYFLKLTQMSQDLVEDMLWFLLRNMAARFKERFGWGKKKKEPEAPQEIDVQAIEDAVKEDSTQEIEADDDIKEIEFIEAENEEETAVPSEEAPEVEASNGDLTPNQIEEVQEPEQAQPEAPNRQEEFTAHHALFFHSSIFFLWFLVCGLNIPTVLTWAHSTKQPLVRDPSLIPGLALSICSLVLWHCDLPKQGKWTNQLSRILIGAAIVGLLFTPVTLYRLNYLLTFVIVLVTLDQFYAYYWGSPEDDDDHANDDGKHLEDKYENVRAKME